MLAADLPHWFDSYGWEVADHGDEHGDEADETRGASLYCTVYQWHMSHRIVLCTTHMYMHGLIFGTSSTHAALCQFIAHVPQVAM